MAKRKNPWELFVPTKDHYNAFKWCIDNSIRVSQSPVANSKKYKIIKQIKEKYGCWSKAKTVFVSKENFSKSLAQEKVWQFYLHIYLESKK